MVLDSEVILKDGVRGRGDLLLRFAHGNSREWSCFIPCFLFVRSGNMNSLTTSHPLTSHRGSRFRTAELYQTRPDRGE